MEVSTQFNNSLLFLSNRDEDDLTTNLLSSFKTGLVFGIIGLGSFFAHSNIEKVSNLDVQLLPNSIHNVQISNEKFKMNIPFTSEKQENTAIIDMNKKEESEVLDVDNYNRLDDKITNLTKDVHSNHVSSISKLASIDSSLVSIEKVISALPNMIQSEINNSKNSKTETFNSIYKAPIIVGLVIGLVLLAGQYFLGLA